MAKVLTVRYSELAALAECQLKYQLGYAEAMVTDKESEALTRGSAWHALMEGHYKSFREDDDAGRPRDLAKARKRAGEHLNAFARTRKISEELLETLRWMYEGYIDQYGTDSDWSEIVVVENRRTVPLVRHLGVTVRLAVTADLVVFHRVYGRHLLIDHKTESGRDAGKMANSKDNQLDPQRATYSASYQMRGPKKDRIPILGAIHNTARTDKLKRAMILDERFGRGPVYYGELELLKVWEETQNLARDAVEIRLRRGRYNRMYTSPDPDRCSWKCNFKEVHLTARATGRDPAQVALDYGFTRAEPDNPFIGTLEEG